MVLAENTQNRGKYQCTADLLFDWFGFDQTSKIVAHSSEPELRCTLILPLKMVFSALSIFKC